jgi:hypothetical protein
VIAKRAKNRNLSAITAAASSIVMESLEHRQLLSGSSPLNFVGPGTLVLHGLVITASNSCGGSGHGGAQVESTITFSQAPTAVQTGLTALASTDNLAAPLATQTVYLSDTNGVEAYTIDETGTGIQAALTVDENGNPVTAASKSSTTFGAVTDTAVTAEINAIATALNLTAPVSTTVVKVSTPSAGNAIYTIKLADSTTGKRASKTTTIQVDSAGNPVGNESLPFSVIPTAIQTGLNAAAPVGATALATTSTQAVKVTSADGLTTYSTTFTTTGTQTTVTVNNAGTLTNLPTTTTASTTFGAIPTVAQTELQTLATADGVSGTIATTQAVEQYTEASGNVIYAVTLSATPSGSTRTISITIAVDQNGNPTVPPTNGKKKGHAGLFGGDSGSPLGGITFGSFNFGGFSGGY